MNTSFVILNEVKNPRVACWRDHGFFTAFRMTVEGLQFISPLHASTASPAVSQ
ncbi:MAG: hypothetical protein ABIO94_11185 [Opitutaceae bacterium]